MTKKLLRGWFGCDGAGVGVDGLGVVGAGLGSFGVVGSGVGITGSLGVDGGVVGIGFIGMFGEPGKNNANATITAKTNEADDMLFSFILPPNTKEITVISNAITSQASTILPKMGAKDSGMANITNARAIIY
jgi:hypothetical protein